MKEYINLPSPNAETVRKAARLNSVGTWVRYGVTEETGDIDLQTPNEDVLKEVRSLHDQGIISMHRARIGDGYSSYVFKVLR